MVDLALLTVRHVWWWVLAILAHLAIALLIDHATLLTSIWAGHFTTLCRLIAERGQLGTRPGLVVCGLSSRRLLWLAVNLIGCLSTVTLLFLFALVVFFLLAGSPFLPNGFEFCDQIMLVPVGDD